MTDQTSDRASADRPEPTGVFTLVLQKEDFKFSCAHFTLFGPDEAELLHGHNYHVAVEIQGKTLDDEGLLASFVEVKSAIRAACDRTGARTTIWLFGISAVTKTSLGLNAPPMSEPVARLAVPAASDAAEPPEDPEGL